MSFGDVGNYNNNNKKEDYRVTTYSMNTFSNLNSEVEKSKLSFTFWKGMLKISIAPLLPSNDDSVKFNYDDESSIYLSPSLAYQLDKQIEVFMKDPTQFESKGIKTRSLGVIKIIRGTKFGIEAPLLLIEKLDENRNVVGGHLYEFNTKEYYGIDNFDEDEFTFEKTYFEQLEIDFLKITLKGFYESSTGAQAYFNMDYSRFDQNRVMGKLNGISSALGIENKKGYNKNYGGGVKNDPFNSNSSKSNDKEFDYDDIENQFE